MTPREDALYHLGIIEGCLHARGEDAYPVKIWNSLKLLKDALVIAPIVPEKQITTKPLQEEIVLPKITQMGLDKAAAIASQTVVDKRAEPSNDDEKQEEEQFSDSPVKLEPEKKPRKPMPPLSEERKAALRIQLQQARAVRAAKKDTEFSPEEPEEKSPLKPRTDTPSDRLIDTHTGYVGERTDGTLTDADWGDIQKMRYNGLPDARIAKHYGIDEGYLMRFIHAQGKRETAGNF